MVGLMDWVAGREREREPKRERKREPKREREGDAWMEGWMGGELHVRRYACLHGRRDGWMGEELHVLLLLLSILLLPPQPRYLKRCPSRPRSRAASNASPSR